MSGISQFTIANNTIIGNSSFIGAKGPNCTASDVVPPAVDFVVDPTTILNATITGPFKAHGINTVLCVTPPRGGGNVWPIGTCA